MAAYLIVDIEVNKPEALETYRREVPAIVAKYEGRYLVQGGAFEVLEGSWTPKTVVMLEFPTMEALKRWYDSPEYRPFIAQRKSASVASVVAVEGV